MVQAKPRFSSFEEYLSYDDGTDKHYELLNGELIELPPESGENISILSFLHFQLVLLIGHRRVRWGLELEVEGEPKNRYPDLTVIREEHIQQLRPRNTIRLSMQPPLVVIEAVSPGLSNRERDYIDKRKQYQDRGIPEYWLIDPARATVTVLELTDGIYRELGVFRGEDLIQSSVIQELNLTAQQLLQAGGV
ncbi:Uma2 family endonuclease [Coleofasciculus sp. G2-EDA-02]|uniref:Uma2 family endonuclease n=1 Tax=Coleofasciculus sp. G2-EDA-02 TaxID=3069529 RepID=UPI003300F178